MRTDQQHRLQRNQRIVLGQFFVGGRDYIMPVLINDKYVELLSDFGIGSHSLRTDDVDAICRHIDEVVTHREQLATRIRQHATVVREDARRLFDETADLVDSRSAKCWAA